MTNPIVAKQLTQSVQAYVAPKKVDESRSVYSVNPADKEEAKVAGGGIPLPLEEKDESSASQKIEEAVTQINEYVQNLDRKLHFSVDEVSGKTIIRVIDSSTDELIRQIPSEKLLAVSQALEEFSGLLLEAKA